LVIFSKGNIDSLIKNNKNQILDELNIKKVRIVKNQNEIVTYKIKPNFSFLGQKFGNDLKDIIKIINKLDSNDVVEKVRYKKSISISFNGQVNHIEPEGIIVEEQALGDYSIVSNNDFTIGVLTTLSDSLIKEGIVRDVVRHIQNIRKEFDFNVEDRIDLLVEGSDKINDALMNNKSYFLNEVLAVSFNDKSLHFDNFKKIKSNNEEVLISIRKN
jgi:isoleucyl-tRNA synthetase